MRCSVEHHARSPGTALAVPWSVARPLRRRVLAGSRTVQTAAGSMSPPMAIGQCNCRTAITPRRSARLESAVRRITILTTFPAPARFGLHGASIPATSCGICGPHIATSTMLQRAGAGPVDAVVGFTQHDMRAPGRARQRGRFHALRPARAGADRTCARCAHPAPAGRLLDDRVPAASVRQRQLLVATDAAVPSRSRRCRWGR